MSKNITVSVPNEVYEKLKESHPEVIWSEVARRAFINYVLFREGKELVPFDERYEKINELVKIMKDNSLSEEGLITWMCRNWFYTPSEAKIILDIAVGSKYLKQLDGLYIRGDKVKCL